MEQNKLTMDMLEFIRQPAFFVRDGRILRTNTAAAQLQISAACAITALLPTDAEEYAAFTDGCLCLSVFAANTRFTACVTRIAELDLFLLEAQTEKTELRAMALAAQQIREPLSGLMASTDRLLQTLPDTQQSAEMNRYFYQLLRLIGNMSDAARYAAPRIPPMEICNIGNFFAELMEAAATLAAKANHRLEYSGLSQMLFCLINREEMERLVYNLLSNAIKFSPSGTVITASLRRKKNKLCFSVADQGDGIPDNLLGSIFSRFLREPGITDGRLGMGLGMILVQNVAVNHGGTVLAERLKTGGTRITVTFPIRQNSDNTLRSPILKVDYAGERDHGLIELSDTLPAAAYENIR